MTTNKPGIEIYEPSEKGVTAMRKASFRNTGLNRYVRLSDYEALQSECERLREDAERWRYVRRKLCLTGNGDGTCAMQAINLPAAIPGWPEPGEVATFCDAAIDAAMEGEET